MSSSIDMSSSSDLVQSSSSGPGFRTLFPDGVFLRGTINEWPNPGGMPLDLVADFQRELVVEMPAHAEFKISTKYDGWDGCHPNGNFRVEQAGTYRVRFHEKSKEITAYPVDRETLVSDPARAAVPRGEPYVLPTKGIWARNGYPQEVVLSWNATPDTSEPGTFTFEGSAAECFVKATFTLDVLRYHSVYPNGVYFRGTPNTWGLTPMELVADDLREATVTFAEPGAFKIDVTGNWGLSFPAIDMPVSQAGTYRISFQEATKEIVVGFDVSLDTLRDWDRGREGIPSTRPSHTTVRTDPYTAVR